MCLAVAYLLCLACRQGAQSNRKMHIGNAIWDEDEDPEYGELVWANGVNDHDDPNDGNDHEDPNGDNDHDNQNGGNVYDDPNGGADHDDSNGANDLDDPNEPISEDEVHQEEGHAESSSEAEPPELISKAVALRDYNGMLSTPISYHNWQEKAEEHCVVCFVFYDLCLLLCILLYCKK